MSGQPRIVCSSVPALLLLLPLASANSAWREVERQQVPVDTSPQHHPHYRVTFQKQEGQQLEPVNHPSVHEAAHDQQKADTSVQTSEGYQRTLGEGGTYHPPVYFETPPPSPVFSLGSTESNRYYHTPPPPLYTPAPPLATSLAGMLEGAGVAGWEDQLPHGPDQDHPPQTFVQGYQQALQPPQQVQHYYDPSNQQHLQAGEYQQDLIDNPYYNQQQQTHQYYGQEYPQSSERSGGDAGIWEATGPAYRMTQTVPPPHLPAQPSPTLSHNKVIQQTQQHDNNVPTALPPFEASTFLGKRVVLPHSQRIDPEASPRHQRKIPGWPRRNQRPLAGRKLVKGGNSITNLFTQLAKPRSDTQPFFNLPSQDNVVNFIQKSFNSVFSPSAKSLQSLQSRADRIASTGVNQEDAILAISTFVIGCILALPLP